MGSRIIVVDDEQDFLESVERGLFAAGFREVSLEIKSMEAAALFERGEVFDIALIDITMPGMNGVELLELIKSHSPGTECIMVTAMNEASLAVECIRKGAYDYIVKPVSRDDLLLRIRQAQERKRLLDLLDIAKRETLPDLANIEAFGHIITRSPAVFKVLKEAELHAASDVPVLITGESGTGKELLAKAIHLASPRSAHTFTAVNMASLTSSLFDSEFFGYTKGAFTGAERERAGHLEHTNRGTMFLDEIGTLPRELQGKLLRVLQEGEFLKLGTSTARKVDVRFVAATNEDLEHSVKKGMFRKDLYYRLKGAWLQLPPLRQRKEDIPLLAGKFMAESCSGSHGSSIDEAALSSLMGYDFPGNIRELKSIIRAALNLAQGSPLSPRFLPDHLKPRKAPGSVFHTATPPKPLVSLSEMEREYILRTYESLERNKARTAKLLDIGLNTLRRKLESYGIH